MVLAPFSEAYGRNAVYLPTMFLWIVFMIPIAVGKNIQTILVGRFLCGACGSTGSTMVGGTLADMWETHERGTPMVRAAPLRFLHRTVSLTRNGTVNQALFTLTAFLGVGVGPAMMGYVAQRLSWRWVTWITMIGGGTAFILVVLCLRETRGSWHLSLLYS
jgi:MFS family permease